MFTALILVAIGIVIGWNLPQPPWARDTQERITSQVRRLLGGGSGSGGPGGAN